MDFLTSRGYRAARCRPKSVRALRDDLLVPEIVRLHAENYGVYGIRKMHALLRRQGWNIGRDQTGRLMKIAGVEGVKRSKRVFTTKSDPQASKPVDLVKRDFSAVAQYGCVEHHSKRAAPHRPRSPRRPWLELSLTGLYRTDQRTRHHPIDRHHRRLL